MIITRTLTVAILVATFTRSAQAVPPPVFDEAIASAKAAGKPLVVKFGATWCGPCKAMARDAETAAGKAAMSPVVFVTYDIDEEPGASLGGRFGVELLPTMIAFVDGAEIARRSGYGGMASFGSWVAELPFRSMPLARLMAERDPHAQLVAGRRLGEAGRKAEAVAAYKRASSGPAEVAAEASWALARAKAVESRDGIARREAMRIARRWPTSEAAELAAMWLAADPSPPVALLDTVLISRAALTEDLDRLNNIAYAAIKGKAWKAADAVSGRFRTLAPTNPQYLDTVAEIAHAQGRRDEAVETERKAISLATRQQRERFGLAENLARFVAADGSQAREVTSYDRPALEDRVDHPGRPRMPPAWQAAQRAMVDAVRAKCGSAAPEAVSFYAMVVGGQGGNTVVVRPGTPAALASCAVAAVKSVEIETGRVIELGLQMAAPSFDEALRVATERAKADCGAEASGTPSIDAVVSGRRGERATVAVASGGDALRACVAKAMGDSLGTLPAAVIRMASVEFSGK